MVNLQGIVVLQSLYPPEMLSTQHNQQASQYQGCCNAVIQVMITTGFE